MILQRLLITLFIIMQQASTCNHQETEKTTVYITATGDKYHVKECRFLRKSRIGISLSEAIKKGYGPCKVCHPPQE